MPMSSFQSELFPRDGDVDLIFLSGNSIRFAAPVSDPWYRATVPSRPYSRAGEPESSPEYPSYQPEEAASPLACLQQYQFCDASTNRCGSLASWADSQTEAGELFGTTLDPADPPAEDDPAASSFFWFVALMAYSVPGLSIVLLHLGANSLASTRSLYSGMMGSLPDNQWQIDVTQWWATYLAGIQEAVVSSAIGISDPSLQHRLVKPYNQWIQDNICNNQVSNLLFEEVFEARLRRECLHQSDKPRDRSSRAPTTPPSVCSASSSHTYVASLSSSSRSCWTLFRTICLLAFTEGHILIWNGPQRKPCNCSGWPSRG